MPPLSVLPLLIPAETSLRPADIAEDEAEGEVGEEGVAGAEEAEGAVVMLFADPPRRVLDLWWMVMDSR